MLRTGLGAEPVQLIKDLMVSDPRNVCVIGAGTMGGGIAAHLANLGFDVTLLDLTSQSVREAFERAQRARPPHFYLPGTAETVRLGSIDENLDWVSEADWVCEAVVEKEGVKRALFARIDPLLKPDAAITTNTSGLQISLLAEGRSDGFRRRFMGTHFFNPPRYLKLLELIPTQDTTSEAIAEMALFLEEKAARRVVVAKDTPGFIANRFGMWSMIYTVHITEKLGMTVEEVDAITGPFLGRPKSGSFRLNDIVGIDIMQDIAGNLIARCPDDPHTAHLKTPQSMAFLLEKGWIGDKAGQAYYRREGREFFSLDLNTHAYRMKQDVDFGSIKELGRAPLAERLMRGLELRDPVGEFLREYLTPTLQYANYLKKEISHSVEEFDRVMRWGFGWQAGPFEMIDMIGEDKLGIESKRFYLGSDTLSFSGEYVPRRSEPQYATLSDFPIIKPFGSFVVRDLGDGVHGLCVTTKMGVYGPQLIREMSSYLESGDSQRIVLASEARVFSAGFDLKFLLERADEQDWDGIEKALQEFQNLGALLRQVPSVAAVFGTCLGGGFEMAASCGQIAAAAETKIGMPESRVGLVPSGGGIGLMHVWNQGSAKSLAESARHLTLGTIFRCADEARKRGYLRRDDVTVYHPDRLFTDARALATDVSAHGEPEWKTVAGPVVGMIEQMQAELTAKGELTRHDGLISDKIKSALAKADSFEDALARERSGFVELMQDGLTQTRIRHMVETGKPLSN